MNKRKKITIFVCILILTIGSLWLYWEWPMAMDTLLPEETWTRAELRYGVSDGSGRDVEFENPALDRILPQLGAVRLTRTENRPYMDDRYFKITLYNGETHPTMIYVGSTGYIHIAEHLDFDHWKTYEGGEDFFRYLDNYSRNLPAVIEVAQ